MPAAIKKLTDKIYYAQEYIYNKIDNKKYKRSAKKLRDLIKYMKELDPVKGENKYKGTVRTFLTFLVILAIFVALHQTRVYLFNGLAILALFIIPALIYWRSKKV